MEVRDKGQKVGENQVMKGKKNGKGHKGVSNGGRHKKNKKPGYSDGSEG